MIVANCEKELKQMNLKLKKLNQYMEWEKSDNHKQPDRNDNIIR